MQLRVPHDQSLQFPTALTASAWRESHNGTGGMSGKARCQFRCGPGGLGSRGKPSTHQILSFNFPKCQEGYAWLTFYRDSASMQVVPRRATMLTGGGGPGSSIPRNSWGKPSMWTGSLAPRSRSRYLRHGAFLIFSAMVSEAM